MKENGIIVGNEDRQALVSTFRSILALLHDFINYDIRQNVCLVGGVRVSLRMTVRSNAEYMANFMRSFIPLEVRPFLNLSIGVRDCSQERLISYQLVYWFFLIKGKWFSKLLRFARGSTKNDNYIIAVVRFHFPSFWPSHQKKRAKQMMQLIYFLISFPRLQNTIVVHLINDIFTLEFMRSKKTLSLY